MRYFFFIFIFYFTSTLSISSDENTRFVQTPYKDPKVVFEFYFNEPAQISAALYWIRSYMNPLMDSPYDYAPEFMDIIVVIHGTEIVTVVKHNNKKYKNMVERMKYYHQLGVKFKVCQLASKDFGYQDSDYYDFIELVPSAMPEIAHWQSQGYALIAPRILPKIYTIEEIR